MRIAFLSSFAFAAAVATVAGCAGKAVSIGNNAPPFKTIAASDISAASGGNTCSTGFEHPNVCCSGSASDASQCGVWLGAPFRACDSGWTTYPDPTECCSIDDPTNCVAPSEATYSDNSLCVYACEPGWWTSPTDSTQCCQQDDRGNTVCESNSYDGPTAVSGGGDDCAPDCVANSTPSSTGSGSTGTSGSSNVTPNDEPTTANSSAGTSTTAAQCNIACPSGWFADPIQPEVCCQQTSDSTGQCFSQATGPASSGGYSGFNSEDAGASISPTEMGAVDSGNSSSAPSMICSDQPDAGDDCSQSCSGDGDYKASCDGINCTCVNLNTGATVNTVAEIPEYCEQSDQLVMFVCSVGL
jgi:hypothetical protein